MLCKPKDINTIQGTHSKLEETGALSVISASLQRDGRRQGNCPIVRWATAEKNQDRLISTLTPNSCSLIKKQPACSWLDLLLKDWAIPPACSLNYCLFQEWWPGLCFKQLFITILKLYLPPSYAHCADHVFVHRSLELVTLMFCSCNPTYLPDKSLIWKPLTPELYKILVFLTSNADLLNSALRWTTLCTGIF